MNTKVLEMAAAKRVLRIIRSDEFARVALLALDDGCDSPSLRILAGLTAADVDEAQSTFERVLGELKIAVPTREEAMMRLSREIANDILIGSTGAYLGAKQIWDLTLSVPGQHLPKLDSFVYAASEWEDRPEDHRIFEDGIRAAAKQLVNT